MTKKKNSKGRPAGSGCCSWARQERNASFALQAERERMTRNDPLVLRSAKQASSSAKGLEFGPSPKQKAQEKPKVENPCEKGATEEISATKTTITTKEEVPCEKGATNNTEQANATTSTTTTKEEGPCEKGATNNTEQAPATTTNTTTKEEIPCEKGISNSSPCEKEVRTSKEAIDKGALSEVDYGTSSSSTSSSSTSTNPAPKKAAKTVADPGKTEQQPKSLDKRPMQTKQQPEWRQEGHQVWRKKPTAPCEKEQDKTAVPCEKGKDEPAGRKFFAVPCEKGKKPRYVVAVDWYNTLYIKDHVPQENLDSLWQLYDEGYELHVVSFCGYKRSLEVKRKAWGLGFPFESVNFTKDKAGWYGKGQWLQDNHIRVLFGDSTEVVHDCLRGGIWVYQISYNQYRSFKDAVADFLRRYPLK